MLKRFADKCEEHPSGCILWRGTLNPNGYGKIRNEYKRYEPAHRFAYRQHHGLAQLDKSLVIDHLCRTILCVNPSHLEAVPQRVNWERGLGPSINAERKRNPPRYCSHGHELAGENLAIYAGRRCCKICNRYRSLKHWREHRC